jgi:AcrR family transcriptional regulator
MESIQKSKKEIVKEKASYLFRKKGYAATSMQDIALAMDMKAASLYNHISSKQELLQELLMGIAKEFTNGMKDIMNSSLDSQSKLEALVNLHVQLTLQNSDSIALITGEWVHLSEPELTKYKKQRSLYEKHFLSILNTCQEQGLIDSKVNTELALYSILSSLHWLYSWHHKHPTISKIELEHQLKMVLLKGILK